MKEKEEGSNVEREREREGTYETEKEEKRDMRTE